MTGKAAVVRGAAAWVAAVVLLVSAATAFAAADIVKISVQAEAVVTGPALTLGDIAVVEGDDAGRVAMFRQIPLGPAPAPGSTFEMSWADVASRLAASGVDFAGVVWQTQPAVTITRKAQVISRQSLLETARAAVDRLLGAKAGRSRDEINIAVLSGPRDIEAPLGNAVLTAQVPFGVKFGVPTVVYVHVDVDGRRVGSYQVRFNVEALRPVVVAARTIPWGAEIKPEDVRVARMDISRLAAGFIDDPAEAVGKMANRTINPGTPIVRQMFGNPVLVRAGSFVTIKAVAGDAEISASGMALQNGAAGQIIKVRNINSQKIVYGMVADAATVLIVVSP